MTASLPRLAVITDVPVERTFGGSLLMHRLLASYPSGRLRVVQSTIYPLPEPNLRLPGVEYSAVKYGVPRLFRNKFNPAWPLMIWPAMRRLWRACSAQVDGFAPTAILTVAHDYLWIPAATLAARLNVPLHLICHDDWMCMATNYRPGRIWDLSRAAAGRLFGRVFRRAASRLCVSQGMVEQYERCFGVTGDVLYPNRGDDSPPMQLRIGRAGSGSDPVVAFAGSLHTVGVHDLLRELAKLLREMNGRLDLYPGSSPAHLATLGLNSPNVRSAGYYPPAQLADELARTSHALFLPASFRPNERTNVSTLFPSKLADYTAMGLPILIWGPDYSSAARWGLENRQAAITITDSAPELVREAVVKVASDVDYATALATGALEAGQKYFDPAAARRLLYSKLAAGVENWLEACP